MTPSPGVHSRWTYVECPRDSWQGLHRPIPLQSKIDYLLALLEAGFTHLDLGSFVSPKAVPQLADTGQVLAALPSPRPGRADEETRDYLCIIANARGLESAAQEEKVTSVGYPLSVSDAFQRRNTGKSLEESWPLLAELRALASEADKRLVVYLSMGFGNPDGEPWAVQTSLDAVARCRDLGVSDVALADTVGRASPELVAEVCRAAVARFGPDKLGVHLHARSEQAVALALAARDAGIRWFEGALGGVGGCPFAGDTLVGNLPTEQIAPALGLPFENLSVLAERARALQYDYA
ncbi:hydroxymethylglutaryl-CoA lyase [Deinococcus peraridilitoris]|nr:hydroxymethylglutaryl-CoA lyase [Deinococcus peraridilitoris]